jgi:hydroxyacylglutathione hydrolase
MKLKTFPVNPFEMNSYVYHDEKSNDGVLIDPAAYTNGEKEEILDYIRSNNITIKYIINTHGHIDHIMGNKWAKGSFNVPVLMNENDLPLINSALEQANMFSIAFPQPPVPDKFLCENDTILFGDCTLTVIHTPGHSPGSVCLVDEKEKLILAGDCVFRGSIGRTDLWKGDMEVLLDSIKNKIFKYPDDFVIYPGHYEKTTIGEEKNFNPFLK